MHLKEIIFLAGYHLFRVFCNHYTNAPSLNSTQTQSKRPLPTTMLLAPILCVFSLVTLLEYLWSIDCLILTKYTKTICCFKPHIYSLHLNTKDVNERRCLCFQDRLEKRLSLYEGKRFRANGIFSYFTMKASVKQANWDNKTWQQITLNANFNVTDRWKLWVSFVKFKLQVKVALVNKERLNRLESLLWRNC